MDIQRAIGNFIKSVFSGQETDQLYGVMHKYTFSLDGKQVEIHVDFPIRNYETILRDKDGYGLKIAFISSEDVNLASSFLFPIS